jgi:hypothetical protein
MPPSSSKTLPFQLEHRTAGVSSRLILTDRRSNARYPLDLSVRFRSFAKGSPLYGEGRAINVSSGGIFVVSPHIVSQHEIREGAHVEMNIEWPSLLDGRIPLQLCAVGWVVRRRPFDFAASFERYQFRTMKSSARPTVRLGADVLEWPPAS